MAEPSTTGMPSSLGAPHGHVAPVVAQHLALLVGGLVLLVHDDQPEVRQRREHRRARAHHHVERAAAAPAPSCAAARPPSGTSGARRRAAEAPAERRHHLGAQRHLGHQHQRLPARLARSVRRRAGRPRSCRSPSRRAAAAGRNRRAPPPRSRPRTASAWPPVSRTRSGSGSVITGSSAASRRARLRAKPSSPPGQRGGQHLAERGEVVLGDPARSARAGARESGGAGSTPAIALTRSRSQVVARAARRSRARAWPRNGTVTCAPGTARPASSSGTR